MPDITLSQALGNPRRQIVTLTASNASLSIPSWARGGKGVVFVTGCGGGGGGNASTGGGGAAWAMRHPLIIPSGQTAMGVVVGAGGAANTDGGSTVISIGGVDFLRLQGGFSGSSSGAAGSVQFWDSTNGAWRFQGVGLTGNSTETAVYTFSSWALGRGTQAGGSTGGSSPFGAGTSFAIAAVGYGSGGGVNSAGSAGFMILEFVEGF